MASKTNSRLPPSGTRSKAHAPATPQTPSRRRVSGSLSNRFAMFEKMGNSPTPTQPSTAMSAPVGGPNTRSKFGPGPKTPVPSSVSSKSEFVSPLYGTKSPSFRKLQNQHQPQQQQQQQLKQRHSMSRSIAAIPTPPVSAKSSRPSLGAHFLKSSQTKRASLSRSGSRSGNSFHGDGDNDADGDASTVFTTQTRQESRQKLAQSLQAMERMAAALQDRKKEAVDMFDNNNNSSHASASSLMLDSNDGNQVVLIGQPDIAATSPSHNFASSGTRRSITMNNSMNSSGHAPKQPPPSRRPSSVTPTRQRSTMHKRNSSITLPGPPLSLNDETTLTKVQTLMAKMQASQSKIQMGGESSSQLSMRKYSAHDDAKVDDQSDDTSTRSPRPPTNAADATRSNRSLTDLLQLSSHSVQSFATPSNGNNKKISLDTHFMKQNINRLDLANSNDDDDDSCNVTVITREDIKTEMSRVQDEMEELQRMIERAQSQQDSVRDFAEFLAMRDSLEDENDNNNNVSTLSFDGFNVANTANAAALATADQQEYIEEIIEDDDDDDAYTEEIVEDDDRHDTITEEDEQSNLQRDGVAKAASPVQSPKVPVPVPSTVKVTNAEPVVKQNHKNQQQQKDTHKAGSMGATKRNSEKKSAPPSPSKASSKPRPNYKITRKSQNKNSNFLSDSSSYLDQLQERYYKPLPATFARNAPDYSHLKPVPGSYIYPRDIYFERCEQTGLPMTEEDGTPTPASAEARAAAKLHRERTRSMTSFFATMPHSDDKFKLSKKKGSLHKSKSRSSGKKKKKSKGKTKNGVHEYSFGKVNDRHVWAATTIQATMRRVLVAAWRQRHHKIHSYILRTYKEFRKSQRQKESIMTQTRLEQAQIKQDILKEHNKKMKKYLRAQRDINKAKNAAETTIQKLKDDNKKLRAKRTKLREKIGIITAENESCERANTKIQGHIKELKSFMIKLEEDHVKLTKSIERWKSEILPQHKEQLQEEIRQGEHESRMQSLYRVCILRVASSVKDHPNKRVRREFGKHISDLWKECEAEIDAELSPQEQEDEIEQSKGESTVQDSLAKITKAGSTSTQSSTDLQEYDDGDISSESSVGDSTSSTGHDLVQSTMLGVNATMWGSERK